VWLFEKIRLKISKNKKINLNNIVDIEIDSDAIFLEKEINADKSIKLSNNDTGEERLESESEERTEENDTYEENNGESGESGNNDTYKENNGDGSIN
jgi:hypothetical protein